MNRTMIAAFAGLAALAVQGAAAQPVAMQCTVGNPLNGGYSVTFTVSGWWVLRDGLPSPFVHNIWIADNQVSWETHDGGFVNTFRIDRVAHVLRHTVFYARDPRLPPVEEIGRCVELDALPAR